jgi:hypothetical protein
MNGTVKAMAAILVVALLAGCATQTQTGAAVGVGVGAAVGAVAGAIFGNQKGVAIGAATGAAVGGVVGALVGQHLDQQVADRAAAARQINYAPSQGTRVDIQRSDVTPMRASPGTTVVASVEYSVVAANAGTPVTLSETRVIQRDGETIRREQRQLSKPQGVHRSAYEFKIPDGMPEGPYTLMTVLEAPGTSQGRRTAEVTLNVVR